MGIAITALLILLALLVAPVIVWGGVERSLDDRDDEVCDRDRSRECRQMAEELLERDTIHDSRGTKR